MTSSSPSSTGVSSAKLFSDVQRLVREQEDYGKAIKLLDKIVGSGDAGCKAHHQKALHCKAVCQIQLEDFTAALSTIAAMDAAGQSAVAFEQAYCLYRLKRVQEAVDRLQGLKSSEVRVKELLAQALYRLERLQDSYTLYVDLIKNSNDEFEEERETNLSAVMARISMTSQESGPPAVPGKLDSIGEQTFELCFNKALIAMGQGNYGPAQEMLDKAADLCDLPTIGSVIGSVDVDALEECYWSLGAKYVRKAVVKGSAAVAADSKPDDKKKTKKKRKRKPFRGKNYDPNVDPDPERWLPKWQRSQFRRKKDRRKETNAIGKGSQGVVADPTNPEAKPSPKAGHQQPQSPPGPRQQSWHKKKKGKR